LGVNENTPSPYSYFCRNCMEHFPAPFDLMLPHRTKPVLETFPVLPFALKSSLPSPAARRKGRRKATSPLRRQAIKMADARNFLSSPLPRSPISVDKIYQGPRQKNICF
jgi:hypothetical protein